VLTPLVQEQIDDWAARARITPAEAKLRLFDEKQPSLEFATPEQSGRLAAFLCSVAPDPVPGKTLGIDGRWTPQ